MPQEYVELMLCRDVFHCTPSMLRDEDAEDILAALACLEAEQKVQAAQQRGRKK